MNHKHQNGQNRPSFAHRTFVFFLSFSCFIGCGSDDDFMPLSLETSRCSEPGICLVATGKKSLQGSYRENDEELKFDVLYRPYRGFSVGDVFPWCVRLIDHKNQEFSFADNGHCPAAWYRRESLQRLSGDESYFAYNRRDELVKKLRQVLDHAHAPKDRETALQVLQEIVSTHLSSVMGSYSLGVPNRENDDKDAAKTRAILGIFGEPTAVEEDGFGMQTLFVTPQEEFPDDDELTVSGFTRLTNASANSRSDQAPAPELAPANHLLSVSGRAPDAIPKTSPEEVIEDPQSEFKQKIVLYSQNVKGRLLWGRRTKKHHTASYIEVLKRPLGSDRAWEKVATAYTANHGSNPLSPFMKPYDVCEDTPVTYGRTVWKGECSGGWGIGDSKHLCNDDTRLQVRNAYNIASNKKCEKVDHYHRPWCQKR